MSVERVNKNIDAEIIQESSRPVNDQADAILVI